MTIIVRPHIPGSGNIILIDFCNNINFLFRLWVFLKLIMGFSFKYRLWISSFRKHFQIKSEKSGETYALFKKASCL